MTNLKDKIYDVCVDYIKETNEGVPDDAEAFAESVMEEIREYFTNILG